MGLVSQVFDEPTIKALTGDRSIAHTRYSTSGASDLSNAQPILKTSVSGNHFAVAHNGNIDCTEELKLRVDAACSDTELVAELLAREHGTVEHAIRTVVPRLAGAYCLVVMDTKTLFGVRDPHGFRPLSIGRLPERGLILASETAALDAVGADLVRDVEPGEIVAISDHGLRSWRFSPPKPSPCMLEYIYLARADSVLSGMPTHAVRHALGSTLALEAPVDADLVIPIPETATIAALGYAEQSGIPFGIGLIKNNYVGRTFIQPTQSWRQLGVRLKFNVLRDVVRGRSLVVVDDSIVRANTTAGVVALLRAAGVAQIHVRIASPPIRWPCFYGIDMPTRDDLVSAERTPQEVADLIGADSVAYLSLPGMVQATQQPIGELCTACFTGRYPVLQDDRASVAESEMAWTG